MLTGALLKDNWAWFFCIWCVCSAHQLYQNLVWANSSRTRSYCGLLSFKKLVNVVAFFNAVFAVGPSSICIDLSQYSYCKNRSFVTSCRLRNVNLLRTICATKKVTQVGNQALPQFWLCCWQTKFAGVLTILHVIYSFCNSKTPKLAYPPVSAFGMHVTGICRDRR